MKYPGKESSTLEFKRDLPQSKQIIKTMVGFCNQQGGRLVIGVDNDGEVLGLSTKSVQDALEWLDKSVYDACSPPILPSVYSQNIADKLLLIVDLR